MTGVSEILILILLITCILILPRMFKQVPKQKSSSKKKFSRIPVNLRLYIVLSFIWPSIMALYLKPWNNNITSFVSYGIVPVIMIWAVAWIIAGKKKQ